MNIKVCVRIATIGILFFQYLPGTAQMITTYAGTNLPTFFSGGAGTTTQLYAPQGVCMAPNGMLYIADELNYAIRKLNTNTGFLTTIAGNGTPGYGGDGGSAINAQFYAPAYLAMDNSGNIYVADFQDYCIRKITPAGTISTIAGTGIAGYSGDGGPATAARLNNPLAVAVDSSGNVYIADQQNMAIRKVTPSGIISTIAGNGTPGYSGDGGPATSAKINAPTGVAVDSAGNVYIADNQNNRIRKVSTAGVITTIAGNGTAGSTGNGGPATAAELAYPLSVALDKNGNVYIVDEASDVRKINHAGIISKIAGNGLPGYSGDGGPANSAALCFPGQICADTSGNLFIADYGNDVIRKINTSGIISTVAGNKGYGGDGSLATAAQFRSPTGLATDQANNVYIVDQDNNTVRKISTAGIISIVAGNNSYGFSGDGGPALNAAFARPISIAVDKHNNLFISDRDNYCVRRVDGSTGIITTYAGQGGIGGYSGDGGAATSAKLHYPYGIAVDSADNLYISGYAEIRRVDAITGIITTYAGDGTTGNSGDGALATAAKIGGPAFLAIDALNNLYIADQFNNNVRKVNASNGLITTVAGNNTCTNSSSVGDGGPPVEATLCQPVGIALDADGNLYVSCVEPQNTITPGVKSSERIRKVTSTTGTVTTTTGRGIAGKIGDAGIADSAYIYQPAGLCFDPAGDLYIADQQNRVIRKINYGTAGVPKIGQPSASISLYPNPNNGVFRIEGTVPVKEIGKEFTIEITDILGQRVYHAEAKAINNGLYMPIRLNQSLPTGVYYCKITGEVTNVTLKFSLNR